MKVIAQIVVFASLVVMPSISRAQTPDGVYATYSCDWSDGTTSGCNITGWGGFEDQVDTGTEAGKWDFLSRLINDRGSTKVWGGPTRFYAQPPLPLNENRTVACSYIVHPDLALISNVDCRF
jgi:hypothetical protein